MNVTEVLVNGFDGTKAVFAATLPVDGDARVLTVTEGGDSATVDTVTDVATAAFVAVRQVIEGLITNRPERD